jgi:hypothetical protein
MLPSNVEFVIRFTDVNPDEVVGNPETRTTFGINKFFVGHKLKIQTDFMSINIDGSDNSFVWRTQMDIHF